MMEYVGARCTIRDCEEPGAGDDPQGWVPPSWTEALEHIPVSKRDGIRAKMTARRQVLADKGQLRSPDYWNTEGDLPNGKKFYAIKADKIRAYGWFSSRHKGVFYISHFAFKKGPKLAAADTRRVVENWRQIEEQA
jgi:hypothetical protein